MAKTLLACSESVYAWNVLEGSTDGDAPLAPLWMAKANPATGEMRPKQLEVVWAPQHITFASAGEDGRITFNRPNGEYMGSLSGASTATHSLDFHPKSRILVSGGEDSIVRVWDLKDKKVAMTWKPHTAPVASVRCCPDEDHVASADVSGTLFVHNLRNGKTVTKLQQRGEEVKDAIKMIQYSPFERSRIAVCTDTGKVLVWESSRAKLLVSISAHIAPCSALSYSHVNSSLLVSASLDKTIKLHDVRARKTVSTIQVDSPASSLDMAADGTTIAVGTVPGSIYIYDLQKSNKPIQTLTTAQANPGEVEHLCFQHTPPHSQATKSMSSTNVRPSTTTKESAATQADKFFAPSPQTSTGPQPTSSDSLDGANLSEPNSSRSSLGPTGSVQPMDLLSPIKSFETEHMSSTPNLHLNRQSSSSLDMPFTPLAMSNPQLSLNVLSPMQSEIAPSGAPLSFFSPAPPTPSSYKPTSRLSSALFSPLSTGVNASDGTPTKAPSFTSSASADYLSFSPRRMEGASTSPSITPRRYVADEPHLVSPTTRDLSLTPGHTAHSFPSFTLNSTPLSAPESKTPRAEPSSPTETRAATSSSGQQHESIQWQLIQSILGDMMDGFRSEVQIQLQSMHMEMIRQFHIQQMEVGNMLQQHADTTTKLLDIIKELREENERLRKFY